MDPTQPPSTGSEQPAQLPFIDEPPAWPKIVGWISTVWGTIGLGCLGCGVIGIMMPILFSSGMQQQFPDGLPPILAAPPVTVWVSTALSGLVAGMLIASGVMLILRRSAARIAHLGYAALAIIIGGFGIWASVEYQQALTDWCNQNPGTKFAQQQQSQGAFSRMMLIVSVVMTFAWPVFCVVWFGFVKPDAAEIERGRALTL